MFTIASGLILAVILLSVFSVAIDLKVTAIMGTHYRGRKSSGRVSLVAAVS